MDMNPHDETVHTILVWLIVIFAVGPVIVSMGAFGFIQ